MRRINRGAMRRRKFILALAGAAAWPLGGRAQQPAGRVYRVGILALAYRGGRQDFTGDFVEGLRSLGYRIGENVVIEYRFANGDIERLPALAADLVRLRVDVIVTGFNPQTDAAMKATSTIPIIMSNSIDPVSAGFVASLAHPGGNVTGFAADTGSTILGKRFELIKEALPNDVPKSRFPTIGSLVPSVGTTRSPNQFDAPRARLNRSDVFARPCRGEHLLQGRRT